MHSLRSRLVPALLLVLAASAARGAEQAEQQLYQRVLRSAVWVVTVSDQDVGAARGMDLGGQGVMQLRQRHFGMGSGSVIDLKRRVVITNAHVVGEHKRAFVLFPVFEQGKTPVKDQRAYWFSRFRTEGTVIAKDEGRDLALIRLDSLPAGHQAISLAGGSPERGQRVYSVGNPGESKRMWVFRSGAVVSDGPMNLMTRNQDGSHAHQMHCRMLVADWYSEHGESGSPMVDDQGRLVGVLTSISPAEKQTVGTDIAEVKAFLEEPDVVAKLGGSKKPATNSGLPASRPAVPAWAEGASPASPEEEAAHKLKLAESLAEAGVKDKARERLREIQKNYPDTTAARRAGQMLEELDAAPVGGRR